MAEEAAKLSGTYIHTQAIFIYKYMCVHHAFTKNLRYPTDSYES